MRVVIGSDHAGFLLKEELRKLLADDGHEIDDVGTHSEESTDYPDFAVAVGEKVVASKGAAVGVLVCGTGLGVSIAANKVAGVRAARVDEPYSARLAREHNDANVICVGQRVIGAGVAADTVRAFLAAKFAGGRHQRRIDKIAQIEAAERARK